MEFEIRAHSSSESNLASPVRATSIPLQGNRGTCRESLGEAGQCQFVYFLNGFRSYRNFRLNVVKALPMFLRIVAKLSRNKVMKTQALNC